MAHRKFYDRLSNINFAWTFFYDSATIIRIKKTLRFVIKGENIFVIEFGALDI